MTVTTLPRPLAATRQQSEGRWVPTRAGLLNVWRYYDEVLEFHGGRLLLRGANGSGKSKALELLLPYLLDANLRAQRLSTFGTGERTMHWNLMGQGATGVTRVGYVWVEFGATDADDTERWFTAGARLQATSHTTTVHADYFTTSRRVGHDLTLVTGAGTPLTRAELTEALGDEGTRHDHAADYRATVRRALFGAMSEQRYDALITALLQLRTPKLSQRLDPALLSTLLSRALPPLGEHEVSDLAEGFERLDRQRERLARLDEEVAAATVLAARQRTYARRVLRSGAAGVVSATSEMDGRTRAARLSEQRHTEVAARRTAAEERSRELESVVDDATTRLEALRDSEAYRQGTALEDLRRQLLDARGAAGRAEEAAGVARHAATVDAEAADTAVGHADRQEALRASRGDEAVRTAREAGLSTVLTRAAADDARRLVHAAVDSRRHQIGEVRRDLGTWDHAVALRTEREAELDHARATLAEAGAAQTAADERCTEAVADLAERLDAWVRGAQELAGHDVEALVDAVLDAVDSEVELRAIVDRAAARVRRELDLAEAAGERRRTDLTAERDRLQAERDRVAAETEVAPPPLRTSDRTGRPGAPLWRLLTFTDTAPPEQQAAVEAALAASGLLDAWVAPTRDGLAVDGHDVFVRELTPAPGPSLLEVVVPDTGAASTVDTGHLRDLLGGIALDHRLETHMAVISTDGGFRLASLYGSASKPEAELIGAAARERARRRRLAELADGIAALDPALAEVGTELAALGRRRRRLDDDLDARPGHRQVDDARAVLTRAEAAVAHADQAVRRWVERRAEAEARVVAALRALTARASEHVVPTEREALDALDRAVTTFGKVADLWLAAEADARHARDTAERARAAARRSAEVADDRADEAEAATTTVRRLNGRVTTVEATVGAEYREVLARIAATREEEASARRESKSVATALRELDGRLGELEATLANDRTRREEAVAGRDAAADRFRVLWRVGLPLDAGWSEELAGEGTKATLEIARAVAAAWAGEPHEPRNVADALGRLAETVHVSRDTLGARADLALETEDDVQVLRAVVDGRTLGAAALLTAVTAEAERSRTDITAAEQELFDTTLTGETRRHLAARIREADALVDAMNERLAGVRTASNVAVTLQWKIADDVAAGTRTARDLLLKDPVRLSEDDRAALHRFFRDRIDTARAEGTAGSWEQQLTEVFDYTRWHQFVVRLDRGDGRDFQPLTKKLHGALSGGEKAIALHLPLFAAIAAYYESVPGAPRLILLDEVFVGVDEVNRGQVFGLLAALGLDLVLTSDHEWCLYREIDAIAIHQLITGTDDADDAVTTARWTWNGRELEEA